MTDKPTIWARVEHAARYDGGPHYMIGNEEYDTELTEPGDVYRACLGEYGRCVSKVYVEPSGRAVGWCFERREPLDGARTGNAASYVLETWVTLRAGPTRTIIERAPHVYLDGKP